MWGDGWREVVRVIGSGLWGYGGLVLLLRLSGKRTLSKMNIFDFVVTVSFGSTLASVLLSRDVGMAEGMTAFAILIGLQWITTSLTVRSAHFRALIKAEPTLLFYRGEYLRDAMRGERVGEEEVRKAVRAQGLASMSQVEAVILETDGSFTVVQPPPAGAQASALQDVNVPAS